MKPERQPAVIDGKPNICSPDDIVRLVIKAGRKGISIQEIHDTTLVGGKSWDTERPHFLFEQFEKMIERGDLIGANNRYWLSWDYIKRLNEPVVIIPLRKDEDKYYFTFEYGVRIKDLQDLSKVSPEHLDDWVKKNTQCFTDTFKSAIDCDGNLWDSKFFSCIFNKDDTQCPECDSMMVSTVEGTKGNKLCHNCHTEFTVELKEIKK